MDEICRDTPIHTKPYLELLNDVIKELLKEGRNNKLQTFGYSLEDTSTVPPQGQDVQM